MKILGEIKAEFPENSSEAHDWKALTSKYALDRLVMAVAHTRIEGAWCAYIHPVAGINHEQEWQSVLYHGSKLPEHIALAIFPRFTGIPYAN